MNVYNYNLLATSESDFDNSGEPGPQAEGVNHPETPFSANKQLYMIGMTPQAHVPISTRATRIVHISIGFTCITTTTLLQGQAVHTCAVFRQSR